MTVNLANQIAKWIKVQEGQTMPPTAIAIAKRAIVDTLGCAIAGRAEPCVAIVRDLYANQAETGTSLITADGWASVEHAVLIGGVAAHALDYDDVCVTVTTHPSAVIVPTVLAIGQAKHRSGADVITAYLIGLEVSTRIGEVMGFGHYQLGWHPTKTLGVLGATAAAGYLLGLDEERLQSALGIAGSLAGGLRRNFGTMTKPLHAGLAAQQGVQAALLAEKGLTADMDIFGPGGFFLAFGGGQTEQIDRLPLGEPLDVESSGLAVKMFPCCYATHRIIDCTISLAREHDLAESDVESILITAPPGALAPLNRPRPITGLEGKFSAEYTAAAALIDRRVNLASFTDQAVLRPNLQSLLKRVQARELDPSEMKVKDLEDGEVVVSISLRNGRKLEARSAYPPGSSKRPLTDQELRIKFSDCLSSAGVGAAAATQLFEVGMQLEQCQDISTFSAHVMLAGRS
jgi:2-methylcitrate dehydratase PrpD